MYVIIGIIYIVFIMITIYLVVRDRKHPNITRDVNEKILVNSKADKLTIIIGICTCVMYSIIGYCLKTDMLIPVTVHKNGGSISFVGIILWVVTTLVIRFIIEIGKKIYKRKSSS